MSSGRIDLASMQLEKAIVEVRYRDAFLLWDTSGKIWDRIATKHRNVKRKKVEPNHVTCLVDNRYEISVLLERTHLLDFAPSADLSDLKKVSKFVISLLAEYLQIQSFTRVGFRVSFVSKQPDRHAASKRANELTRNAAIPSEATVFNIQGKVLEPKASFVWRTDTSGIRVSIEAETRKLEFSPPPDTPLLKPVQDETSYLVVDFDYFIDGEVLVSQLRISDWIDQAFHLIRRDAKKLG